MVFIIRHEGNNFINIWNCNTKSNLTFCESMNISKPTLAR
jgi:hypothetical protein